MFGWICLQIRNCTSYCNLSHWLQWLDPLDGASSTDVHQTRNERYVWASSLVILHSSKRRGEAWRGSFGSILFRFLGCGRDMPERYTVYTCKMHLRMRQTITWYRKTAFCTLKNNRVSWALHHRFLSIAAGCSWKPVMQKVSTAGSRWEGWTA